MVAFIMILFIALFIIVNVGVITFLSLRRLMFVNLQKMIMLRKSRRRTKIEVEPLEDHTVIESVDESEESKVYSLDDEDVAISS